MNTVNPYAPPRANVIDVPTERDELELAGAGVRLGAYLLDQLLVVFVVWVPFGVAIALSLGNRPGVGTAIAWLAFAIGGIALIWFNVIYVLQNGQSIAKKWLGIKVVRTDGTPASLGIFWLRNVVNGLITGAFGLYFLVDSLLIFGDSRQCVHDKIADTIVVVA